MTTQGSSKECVSDAHNEAMGSGSDNDDNAHDAHRHGATHESGDDVGSGGGGGGAAAAAAASVRC